MGSRVWKPWSSAKLLRSASWFRCVLESGAHQIHQVELFPPASVPWGRSRLLLGRSLGAALEREVLRFYAWAQLRTGLLQRFWISGIESCSEHAVEHVLGIVLHQSSRPSFRRSNRRLTGQSLQRSSRQSSRRSIVGLVARRLPSTLCWKIYQRPGGI